MSSRPLTGSKRLMFLSVVIVVAAPVVTNGADEILNKPVGSFVRKKVSVADIAISIASELSIPTGFEGLPGNPAKDLTIDVRDTTIKGLLDELTRADPRYEWEVAEGRIIDIYPRNKSERFLDVLVPQFRVEDKTRGVALDRLTQTPAFARLLANLHATLHTPISPSPSTSELGPKISIDLQNSSVRQILNTIVIASHGSGWAAVRYGDRLQYLSLSIGG